MRLNRHLMPWRIAILIHNRITSNTKIMIMRRSMSYGICPAVIKSLKTMNQLAKKKEERYLYFNSQLIQVQYGKYEIINITYACKHKKN